MKFCQRYEIHLISDEIYALSVWQNPEVPDAVSFESVLSIDTTGIIDPGLVHILWGMSKVGLLENPCLIKQELDDDFKGLRSQRPSNRLHRQSAQYITPRRRQGKLVRPPTPPDPSFPSSPRVHAVLTAHLATVSSPTLHPSPTT